MKRVEKDPHGGWIARKKDGSAIFDENWRWNSRSVARTVVAESDDDRNPRNAPSAEPHTAVS